MSLLKKKPATCQKCGQLWPGRRCRTCAQAAGGPKVPDPRKCHDCGLRWAQERGICRQCARARGDGRTLRELGAAILARQADRRDGCEVAVYLAKPARTLVAAGVEYDVVWDGRVRPLEPER